MSGDTKTMSNNPRPQRVIRAAGAAVVLLSGVFAVMRFVAPTPAVLSAHTSSAASLPPPDEERCCLQCNRTLHPRTIPPNPVQTPPPTGSTCGSSQSEGRLCECLVLGPLPPKFVPMTQTRHETAKTDLGDRSSYYLERQTVDCSGDPLSSFHMRTVDEMSKIQYEFKCSKGGLFSSSQLYSTESQEDGDGDLRYLDRLNVDCGDRKLLSKFSLARGVSGTLKYDYTCLEPSNATKLVCRNTATSLEDDGGGGKALEFLDRQTLSCDQDEVIQQFNLQHDFGKIRYNFRCCKIGGSADAQNRRTVTAVSAMTKLETRAEVVMALFNAGLCSMPACLEKSDEELAAQCLPCAVGYLSMSGHLQSTGSINSTSGQAVDSCADCATLCDSNSECNSYSCNKFELRCKQSALAVTEESTSSTVCSKESSHVASLRLLRECDCSKCFMSSSAAESRSIPEAKKAADASVASFPKSVSPARDSQQGLMRYVDVKSGRVFYGPIEGGQRVYINPWENRYDDPFGFKENAMIQLSKRRTQWNHFDAFIKQQQTGGVLQASTQAEATVRLLKRGIHRPWMGRLSPLIYRENHWFKKGKWDGDSDNGEEKSGRHYVYRHPPLSKASMYPEPERVPIITGKLGQ